MEQSKSDIRLGRFLSLVLRHDPDAANITLDEHGWADVEALLSGQRMAFGCANMCRRNISVW